MAQQFSITAELRLKAPANLGQVAGQIRNQLSGINATVGLNTAAATAGLQKVSSGAKASAQALRVMQAQAAATAATLTATVNVTNSGSSAFKQFSEQAGLAARRFAAFTVAAGTMVNVIRGIKEGVRAAVEFELSMNKAAQVSSLTTGQLGALGDAVTSLSRNLGVSSAALAETQVTLLQAGLSAKQTTDALKALALTDLAPTFDSMKQSTEGLIAAFRQFSLTSGQFESTLSSMNAVSAQFAVESADLITAVQKAGGAFRLSAGDMKSGSEALNEFMGLFTAVRATTRESADSIATGLRTIFTRFQRADTVKALQDLGINLRYTRNEARAMGDLGLEDQFVGAYEAVKRLSQGLEGLRETDPRYAQAIEQLGGYRQISRVIPLLKEFKTAEEAKNTAIAGGIKLQLDAEKRQETMAAKIIKLKEEYLDLFRKITNDKGFQVVANSLLGLASGFAKVVDAARPLLPVLLGLAAVKLGLNFGNIVSGFGRAFLAPPGAAIGKTGSGTLRFAAGSRTPIGTGFVSGTGNNDTESALLMPGEFVLNKGAVARMGAPNLRDLNEGKSRFQLKRYATGSKTPVGGVFTPNDDDVITRPLGGDFEEIAKSVADRLKVTVDEVSRLNSAIAVAAQEMGLVGKQFDRSRAIVGKGPGGAAVFKGFDGYQNDEADPVPLPYGAKTAQFPGQYPKTGTASEEAAARAAATPAAGETANALKELTAKMSDAQKATFFGGYESVQKGALSGGGQVNGDAAIDAAIESWAKKVLADKVDVSRGDAAVQSYAFGHGENVGRRAKAQATTAVDVAQVGVAQGAQAAPSAAVTAANDKLQELYAKAGLSGQPQDYRGLMSLARQPELGLPVKGPDSIYGLNNQQLSAQVDGAIKNFLVNGAPATDTPAQQKGSQWARSIISQVDAEMAAQSAGGDGAVPPSRPTANSAGDDENPRPNRRGRTRTPSVTRETAAQRAEREADFAAANPEAALYQQLALEQAERNRAAPAGAAARERYRNDSQTRDRVTSSQDENGQFRPVGPATSMSSRAEVAKAEAAQKRLAQQSADDRAKNAEISARAPGTFSQGGSNILPQQWAELIRQDEARLANVAQAEAAQRAEEEIAQKNNRRRGRNNFPPRDQKVAGYREELASDKVAYNPQNAVEVLSRAFSDPQNVSDPQYAQMVAQVQKDYGDIVDIPKGLTEPVQPLIDQAKAQVYMTKQARVTDSLAAQKAQQEKEDRVLGSLRTQKVTESLGDQRAGAEAEARVTGSLSAQRAKEEADARAQQEETRRVQKEARRQTRDQFAPNGPAVSTQAYANGQTVSENARAAQRAVGGGDQLNAKAAALNLLKDPAALAALQADPQRAADVLGQVRASAASGGNMASFRTVEAAFKQAGVNVADSFGGTANSTASRGILATFNENEDGSRTLVDGPDYQRTILAERARRLADQRLTARGGEENLSDKTIAAVRSQAATEEEEKVRRELISAQENLLKLLNPQMEATERYTKAVEDTEKAMSGMAEVAKDHNGKLLGLADSVDKAKQQGIAAPGAGGGGYGIRSRISDAANRAREFYNNNAVTRLNRRLSGFTEGPGFTVAAGALAGAGAYASNQFTERAGTAADAYKTESGTSKYTANTGAAGAVSGALFGAGTGFAVGGPIGAAVGAVAGGAYGLYTSLKEAEKNIRQAKIDGALSELGEKLSAFATGLPNAAALAGIDSTISTITNESKARTADEAEPSMWNPVNWFGNGQDPERFAQVGRKNFRQDFGPLLPSINQGLTRRAEALGKDAPDGDIASLLTRLVGTGDSLNSRLVKIVADLRGVPVEEIQKEYRKVLSDAQQAGRVERENKAARQAAEQQVNSYGRLAQAIESAADSLGGLQRRAEALTNVLDGTVGGSRVSANTEVLENGFGRFDPSAVRPFGIINSLSPQLGGGLLSSANAANSVGRELPSVLASVIRTQGLDESNITSRVSEGLYRQLGFARAQDAPQDIQRVVQTVVAGLNESQAHGRGVGGVLSEAQTDVSKYVEKLLGGAVDPLKEYGPRIGRQIQDNANRFVDGLTQLYQRVQQVGQLFDQLAQTRADNSRLATTFAYENAGRRGQVLDGLSLDQLEGGFNARQQRLTGVNGAGAFDPRAIGAQLAQTRTQVQQATVRQQEVFEQTGGRGPQFQAAADEVVRLTSRAANLQQALKHLADVSQRHAAIQEKLNKLKEEEEGRLGLAERFASADPTEQLRMNRGFVLANQAAQAGNLDGFSSEDRRTIIDTLRGAGGVTLTGFNGAPRADDLLRTLLGNSFGGAFRLTQGQQAERRGLQGEALARGAVGEEAIQQLIEHQQQGSQEFFRNLTEQQNQFFSRLERTLLQIRVQDAQNDRARASARVNEIQGRTQARSLLSGVGVNTTAQLDVLRGKTPQVEELRQALATQNAERQQVSAARRGVSGFSVDRVGGKDLGEFLAGSGLSNEQLGRVNTRFNELSNSDEHFRALGERRNAVVAAAERAGREATPEEISAATREQARANLSRALMEEGARDNGGKVREALTPFQGIQGLNVGGLVETLNGPNADAFVRALTQFDNSGNRLEDFGRHLTNATGEVARLDEVLRNLNAQLNPTATPRPGAAATVTRAGGGDIFRPQGSDTVPAMLTPGEFVINAKSASANAALLHEINNAKGAVQYRQTGGPIVRTASNNAPSTSQVAQGYLWAQDKINKGLSWLGFSHGGVVPQYLADGGPAGMTYQEYEARRRTAENQDAARNFGHVATVSELPDDLVRDLNREARKREQATARAEARAERRRQRGLAAVGNAAFAASAANFNRAAFLSNGPRRPGDEGQRSIAARSLESQNRTLERSYQENGKLREFVSSRVGKQMLNASSTQGSITTARFAHGGLVPGTGSTDTVPALLTRGEAVLNTRAVNNLGASAIQQFNKGGLVGNVQYRAEGGAIQGGGGGDTGQLAAALSLFSQATGGFVSSAQTLAQTFNVFAGQAQALTAALSAMPRTLTITGQHQVNVVLNGAEALAKLTPELQQMVVGTVKTEMGRIFKDQMPDAGIVLN